MKELFKFLGQSESKPRFIGLIAGICISIFAWWLIAVFEVVPDKILPNPVHVVKCIPSLFINNNLLWNIGYTISLNAVGYIIALTISIPLGFLIGSFDCFDGFRKIFNGLRYLPIPVITGLFIAGLGLGFMMKSSFLAFGLLIYILPAVINAVHNMNNPMNPEEYVLISAARCLNLTNWNIFSKVVWKHVMPKVYDEICSLTAISYTYVTIAENLNKEGGIGAMINIFNRQTLIPEVYACLIIIVFIGICQDILLKRFKGILFPFIKSAK